MCRARRPFIDLPPAFAGALIAGQQLQILFGAVAKARGGGDDDRGEEGEEIGGG